MMILKIEFAKNKCQSTVWYIEKIPVAWTYPAREHYKNTYFLCFYNLTPTWFLVNFLVHILTPGCKRYAMHQYLTYLCTDINETGPSLVIFLRVDQFYVLRFLFCRVYFNLIQSGDDYLIHQKQNNNEFTSYVTIIMMD